MASFSLTKTLVAPESHTAEAAAYERATQTPFLKLAAQGQVSSKVLGKWLANDRLYIHSYIRGIGRMLSFLDLPSKTTASGEREPAALKLLDWLIDAMVNIRREEKFFVETAGRYGIDVNLATGDDGRVLEDAKLEGLRQFEKLFGTLEPGESDVLPWLESAVVFWGTEKCYLDAWTFAKDRLDETDGRQDADGGALRREFIPNWTCKEFVEFVDGLGKIIDEAVSEVIDTHGEGVKQQLLERARFKWHDLVQAEGNFWPDISSH